MIYATDRWVTDPGNRNRMLEIQRQQCEQSVKFSVLVICVYDPNPYYLTVRVERSHQVAQRPQIYHSKDGLRDYKTE